MTVTGITPRRHSLGSHLEILIIFVYPEEFRKTISTTRCSMYPSPSEKTERSEVFEDIFYIRIVKTVMSDNANRWRSLLPGFFGRGQTFPGALRQWYPMFYVYMIIDCLAIYTIIATCTHIRLQLDITSTRIIGCTLNTLPICLQVIFKLIDIVMMRYWY